MTGASSKERHAPAEISVEDIARAVGGTVVGDAATRIRGIASLEDAGDGMISFYADRRYEECLSGTKASALLVREKTGLFAGPQVVVSNPQLAYARVSGLFASPVPRYGEGRDRAVVHESCRIGRDVSIYPFVYIGKDAVIGDGTILFPGTFVGDRVRIGAGTVIYPNVTILQDCRIGDHVVIHAGTVIGSDGFGFVRDGDELVKIPHLGRVRIDDHVEIGAGNCIDRAALGETWIKAGVKTDNLVHLAHNVVVGEGTLVVALTGISGSVRIGRRVVIGGQVGISDHVEIGDGVMIGSQSGIAKSLSPGEVVSGSPSMPHRLWLKTSGLIKRLPGFNDRLRRIEKKIQDIEKRLDRAGRE
ncbi:MAG: UDP-3-O-(3-hydroxymyristoyl)glucosamine N-acyltransferase [Deltaproteobacteria bacterium]|nr:MAG: UDP-3-O-(3-hydroxymyristoyl)glucosamine N-acyltransferase [Deltaproteobacteria bacterium]